MLSKIIRWVGNPAQPPPPCLLCATLAPCTAPTAIGGLRGLKRPVAGKQQRMVFVAEERNSEVLLMKMGWWMLLVVLGTCTAAHKKYMHH